MRVRQPHWTRRQLIVVTSLGVAFVVLLEGMVALHKLAQTDATSMLVFTAWFRDGLTVVLEHLVVAE